jgi:glycosyltransferase involved in cell wall biosynthesis
VAALKIVHVGKFYAPHAGGIETHVRSLAEGQVARGHEVSVLCMQHTHAPTRRETITGVEIFRLARRLSIAKLDWVPDLVSVIRALRADIIHLHVPNPTMILGLLRARPEAPIVVSHHSDSVAQPLRAEIFKLAERPFYRRVHHIFAGSPAYIEGSNLLRLHRTKTTTIPLGINTGAFVDVPPAVRERAVEIRKRYGAPLWFSCGRLVPYKGYQTAIEALPHAPGTLVIGGDGPLRASLEREAQRRGVAGRVHFLGRIDDDTLRAHLLAADAFWFPSCTRNEAFGLAQVEAMAAGRPVINCDIPGSGVAWVSKHLVSGLTVPPNDSIALAAAASRLAKDSGLLDRLAAGASERARNMFDEAKTIDDTCAAYERIISATQAKRLSRLTR